MGAFFLDIRRIGAVQDVRAVDEADGLEVAFQAPADATMAEIERVAAAKLGFVRSRLTGDDAGNPKSPGAATPRGLIV